MDSLFLTISRRILTSRDRCCLLLIQATAKLAHMLPADHLDIFIRVKMSPTFMSRSTTFSKRGRQHPFKAATLSRSMILSWAITLQWSQNLFVTTLTTNASHLAWSSGLVLLTFKSKCTYTREMGLIHWPLRAISHQEAYLLRRSKTLRDLEKICSTERAAFQADVRLCSRRLMPQIRKNLLALPQHRAWRHGSIRWGACKM